MTTITDPLVRDPATAARGRWLMLVVLLAGQFMALLDVTIVNVAMPTIGRTLHASGAELQLVVAGYTVSYAMLLITGARLGDLYGRRRMFLAGVAVFTLASLACGIAPGVGVLIGARFVQGAGAAAMMPQIMSVIQVRFDGAARTRALSAYTAVLSSGAVAGQVVGGVRVTANLFGQTWRPVFLVNVPIGLAVLALVPRVVPADAPGRGRQLDLAGLGIVGVRVPGSRAGAVRGVRGRRTADRGPGRRSAAEPSRTTRARPGTGPGRGGMADDRLRRLPVQLRAAPAGRAR